MGMIFIFVFFVVAIVYAYLASFTTVLYRHKGLNYLSQIERNILSRRATVAERVGLFVGAAIAFFILTSVNASDNFVEISMPKGVSNE